MTYTQFIDNIVKDNLSPKDSYIANFPKECEGKTDEEIDKLAHKLLKQKENETYYLALVDERKGNEVRQSGYSEEVAERELLWIYSEAKKRASQQDKWNMATVQSLIQPLQELDKIKGLYEVKMKIDHSPIKIEGFDKLKIVDSSGKIIDGEIKKPEIIEVKEYYEGDVKDV